MLRNPKWSWRRGRSGTVAGAHESKVKIYTRLRDGDCRGKRVPAVISQSRGEKRPQISKFPCGYAGFEFRGTGYGKECEAK